MKLYCCFTDAHEVLFREYLAPTLPSGFELISKRVDVLGSGDYLSQEFLECIMRKMVLVIESIRENAGKIIIWSDIDILLFDISPAKLEELIGSLDIVFQREGKHIGEVNTGFWLCRCSERVIRFFERVVDGLRKNPDANEQFIINQMLESKDADIDWGHLPPDFYARTHGWPPPTELAIYHANATPGKDGVGQKIRQFRILRRFRKFGLPYFLWTCVKFAPKRLNRVLFGVGKAS